MAKRAKRMGKTRYIVVTGGVMSGLGKGTAAASIGRLLAPKFTVIPIKCDGYLNTDPGLMNPTEHGEVFVLDDGGEVDMDFGHYERFLNISCKSKWNLTSGKIFQAVFEQERQGRYLGKTVQIIPHVTDEIKRRFYEIAEEEKADFALIGIGGTVGDVENFWFIEAVRQMRREIGPENILYAHLTYVPIPGTIKEQKTRPAQFDIKTLMSAGIWPDIIIGRSEELLGHKAKEKLARAADLNLDAIISGKDIDCIYEIPLIFDREGIGDVLERKFNPGYMADLRQWRDLVTKLREPRKSVTIAVCGKYTAVEDSYASIREALSHAGAHLDTRVNFRWIETTDIEDGTKTLEDAIGDAKGVIVPGGFGARGVEGKLKVIQYAREHDLPFLGLCYGLQLAIVEYARNVIGMDGAHTTEVNATTPHPVIDLLPGHRDKTGKGATMRLGAYKAVLKENTLVRKLYKSAEIHERHRHHYEVNPNYHRQLQDGSLIFSGTSEDGTLVEFIEIAGKKFFVATQAHPELKSKLEKPAPLFYGFLKASIDHREKA